MERHTESVLFCNSIVLSFHLHRRKWTQEQAISLWPIAGPCWGWGRGLVSLSIALFSFPSPSSGMVMHISEYFPSALGAFQEAVKVTEPHQSLLSQDLSV